MTKNVVLAGLRHLGIQNSIKWTLLTLILKTVKKRLELDVGIDFTYLYDKIKAISCKIQDENILRHSKIKRGGP